MRIHLLCDQKWRDLPNLAALRLALRRLGHRVLLSTTKDAEAMISAFRPDCVVFNHLFAPYSQRLARSLRTSGTAVVVLPTEGAVRPELRGIADGEFADNWTMDLFLAWSGESADGVRRRWGLDASLVQVLGCTRFDFYTQNFVGAVTDRREFCRQQDLDFNRPIVTWATAFGYADVVDNAERREKFLREAGGNGLLECYRRIGLGPLDVPRMHAEGRNVCAASVFALAKTRPDWQFVVRPHPAERREFYVEALAQTTLANIRFAPQDYIWNILNASDLHLHRQCTTAVEAWMWGKPTVELAMSQELAWPERERGSDVAQTTDALLEIAAKRIRSSAVDAATAEYRRAYIHHWFGAADGERCRNAARSIDALLRARGRRRNYFSGFKGLKTTVRMAAGSVLRYAAGLTPGQRIVALGRPKRDTSMDKEITRFDVLRYSRKLAPWAASLA